MRDPPITTLPGVYALVLSCESAGTVAVGRRGVLELRAGWYVYTGSAFGPGGLRARANHHLRVSARPRWHIDYLRARTEVGAVWFVAGAKREHEWAARIASLPGATLPMPGFGSSDCACAAHLVRFERLPADGEFRKALGRMARRYAPAAAWTSSR